MALKINGVGKAIVDFDYSVAPTNNASVFLTIKYPHKTWYGITIGKIRVYEFKTDMRHSNLNTITQQVNALISKSQKQKIVIKEDTDRNYIEILDGCNFYQYTGWSI